MHQLFFYFVRIGRVEVKVSDEVNLELEEGEELPLLLNYLLLGDGSVGDLLRHYLRVKWEHVFVLGGQVHGGDSHQVDLLVLADDAVVQRRDQVLVEDGYRQKVSSWLALEASAYLDHPVGHLRAVLLRYLVASQWVRASGTIFLTP